MTITEILKTLIKVRNDLAFERDELLDGHPGLMQLAQDKVDALDRMIELLEQSERRRVRIELIGPQPRGCTVEEYLNATKGS